MDLIYHNIALKLLYLVSDLEEESKKSKVAKLWNQLRSLPMDIKNSFIKNV